jgi:VWFA-related protein
MRQGFFSLILITVLAGFVSAQTPETKQRVRTVTIPISIFTKKELREKQVEEFVQADRLTVKEDKDDQEILSIRSVSTAPLSIAFVIQENLTSTFNLQIRDIQSFIRDLPKGTRVMVAYIRSGGVDVRQRFTDDLVRAAGSLRVVSSSSSLAPRSPFDGVQEVLNRFDAVPTGRRAILLFSDGLDTSQGLSLSSISRSLDLDRAILKAQRKSVAVYSFYSPTPSTEDGSSVFALGAQGALQKLSDDTGGRAFSHGTIAPLSYTPYFKDMVLALNRQFALTYLSTHMKKGYHKVQVQSTNPEVKIEHPAGYYYR